MKAKADYRKVMVADNGRERVYIDVLARLNRGALHPHDAVRALRTEYRNLFLAETNRRTA
jgi:hypothetical protein